MNTYLSCKIMMTSQQENTPTLLRPAGQDRNDGSKSKRITNPRRLLILSPTSHSQKTIPSFLHSLTGTPVSAPPQTEIVSQTTASSTAGDNNNNVDTTRQAFTTSFAGYTTHAPLRLQTKYYTADVPIWVDEIPLTTLPASSYSSSSTSINDDHDDHGDESSGKPQDSNSTTPTPAAQWKTEFLSAEARVVRDAIGAVVICVQNPDAPSSSIPREAYLNDDDDAAASPSPTPTPVSQRADVRALKDLIRMIADVKAQTEEERGETMGEVPGLLVLVGETKMGNKQGRKTQQEEQAANEEEAVMDDEIFSATWWEDELYDMGVFGFEVVVWDPKTDDENDEERRNQFGEYEGMRRIKEVLETHDWAAAAPSNDSDVDDFLHSENERDHEDGGFKLEVNELEREMMGLRFAIQNGDDDHDHDHDNDNDNDEGQDAELKVEELEALMMRMRAIKDMSADLPENQRKAFASKAIRDLMREL